MAFRLGQLDGGGYRALADLKAVGEIAAIGAGINLKGMIPRFLELWPLDFFLVAMPYTLLEQEGLKELETCAARGVAIVSGAPYASGILVRGAEDPVPLPLRAGRARDHRQGAARRRGLPTPRRAAGRRGPAVPAWPPQRRLRDPRAGCRRRSAPEPRLDATRPPRCPVGGAQGGRARSRRGADDRVFGWIALIGSRSIPPQRTGPSSTGNPSARRVSPAA